MTRATPFSNPPRTATVALLCALLAACGGGHRDDAAQAAPSPAPAASPSAAAALAGLDASGQWPRLDRSDSVAGPDADDNGVRDDVDALIDARPDAPERKSALRVLSRALQRATTTDPADTPATDRTAAALNQAVACIWSRFPDAEAGAAVAELRKLTVNTRARFDAYIAYNRARSGAVVALPTEVACE